jgi:hypothetical protein
MLSSSTRRACNCGDIVFLPINQAPEEEPCSNVGGGWLKCAEGIREPVCDPDSERKSTLEPSQPAKPGKDAATLGSKVV